MPRISLDSLTEFTRKHPLFPFLIPAFLAVILGLPYYVESLSPDSCIYLDIGANVAHGKGFITTILNWFTEPSPVVQSAFIQRQPLYPLLLGGFIYFFGLYQIFYLQVFMFLIFLVSLFLAYEWIRQTEGIKQAFFATLYLSTSPLMLFSNIYVSNNSLFTLLVVLSIYIYLKRDSERWSLLLGFIVGLTYLTRLEGSLLFIFYAGSHFLSRKWRQLILFSLVFIVTIAPLLIGRKLEFGSFSKSVHEVNYHTLHAPSEVMRFYEGRLRSFKELFTQHKMQIFKKILRNVKQYSLFFLGTYALSLFFGLLVFVRPHHFQTKRSFHILLLFLFWLLSLLLHWPHTHIYDRGRITTPLIFIVVPIFVVFLESFCKEKLTALLADKAKLVMPLIVIIIIVLNQLYARPFALDWVNKTRQDNQTIQHLSKWINQNIDEDWVICSDSYFFNQLLYEKTNSKTPGRHNHAER